MIANFSWLSYKNDAPASQYIQTRDPPDSKNEIHKGDFAKISKS